MHGKYVVLSYENMILQVQWSLYFKTTHGTKKM